MNLIKEILSWVYPRCCPVCHQIVTPKGRLICEACKDKIVIIQEPKCKKCGKPLEDPEQEFCRDCQSVKHFFDAGIGIFPYDKTMKHSILLYKYKGRREYGDFYGKAAVWAGTSQIHRWNIQGIIPIPLHKRKLRQRGFNQAEYIARIISEELDIPLYTDCLIKTRHTKSQKKLDHRQRRQNLRKAFAVKNPPQIHNVLLVDDVYTTGATLDAAAELLRKNGIKNIYFLTICIGYGA